MPAASLKKIRLGQPHGDGDDDDDVGVAAAAAAAMVFASCTAAADAAAATVVRSCESGVQQHECRIRVGLGTERRDRSHNEIKIKRDV